MTDLLNDIYTDGCKAKKYRLSDFFNRWWDEYAQHPAEYITVEMGGTHERQVAASATPPCGYDLAAYITGLGEAQQERNIEYPDAHIG